jgi:hypothetical protein
MSILNKPPLDIDAPLFLMNIGDDGIYNPGAGSVGQSQGVTQAGTIAASYSPSLDFSDARNSQYTSLLV